MSVSTQYIQKQHAEYPTGDDFADPYGYKGKPEGLYTVSVEQNEGDDDGIGCDGRDWRKPFPSAEQEGADCTDEACQGSEDNIGKGTACDDIGDQASYGDAGNGSRGEER